MAVADDSATMMVSPLRMPKIDRSVPCEMEVSISFGGKPVRTERGERNDFSKIHEVSEVNRVELTFLTVAADQCELLYFALKFAECRIVR